MAVCGPASVVAPAGAGGGFCCRSAGRRGAAARALALAAMLLLSTPLRAAAGSGAPPKPPKESLEIRAADGASARNAAAARVASFDRRSMAGAAKGMRAGGAPAPVAGLVNPDVPALGPRSASMEDMVLPWGYPLESYPAETPDGFVLRLYRIPHGKGEPPPAKGSAPRPAVLLHHGLSLASNSFVTLDPGSSMGFYLADAGFDVWMTNVRGNTYSRGNRYYRSTDEGFWESSLDDLALTDLPTAINYVLNATGHKTLGFVGFSQACAIVTMLLAARPEYNQKMWLVMLVAPVVVAGAVAQPFLREQGMTSSAKVLLDAGMGGGLPNSATTELINGCQDPTSKFCVNLVEGFMIGPQPRFDPRDFARVAATWPSSVGTRNLLHWSQMMQAGDGLRMFDFGNVCPGPNPKPYQETCNMAKYGDDEPPAYDFSKITAKVAMLIGEDDAFGPPSAAGKLMKMWHAQVVFTKVYPKAGHMDFVWARDPPMKADIIRLLREYAPKRR